MGKLKTILGKQFANFSIGRIRHFAGESVDIKPDRIQSLADLGSLVEFVVNLRPLRYSREVRIQMLVGHLCFDFIAKRIHQFRFGHNFTTETEAIADLRKHGLCQLVVCSFVDVIKNHSVGNDDLKFISFGSHQFAERHVVFYVSAVELELRSESAHSRPDRLFESLKHKAVRDVSLQHQVSNSTLVKCSQSGSPNHGIGRAD